ncbi:hypothetical protein AJ88_00590 [Mesorhizobium amorphae CCBAU 01583]|nr:hypothetical protein AJ88_00590 [Mesorhizobium amorphae CCBAU 01583]
MTVTSGKKGPGFHAVRLLIRAYRSYRWVLGRLGWRQEVPHRPVDAERSLVLISNHILTREDRSAISGDAKGFAFICHDLIPVLRPDLVGSGLAEKAFGTYLERLVRSGATAFCTSAEASVTLTDHMRQAGIAPPVIHRFPMPSILYETASRLDMTSRFEPDEPFGFTVRPSKCGRTTSCWRGSGGRRSKTASACQGLSASDAGDGWLRR